MSVDKRLEEIINNLPYSIKHEGNAEKLIEYAKEQAERVQELEEKHKEYVSFIESNNYNMDIEFEKLYKQNKRYREALEEIVHQENLKETNVFGYDHEDISSYVEEVARKALEGEE